MKNDSSIYLNSSFKTHSIDKLILEIKNEIKPRFWQSRYWKYKSIIFKLIKLF